MPASASILAPPLGIKTPAAHSARDGPRFGAWAELYWRFRPVYPAPVFAQLATIAPSRALCVELGAGSGQATASLLELFDHVVAVEPDDAMAQLLPAAPGLSRVIARAEDYQGPSAPADAVVAASALHWMDQAHITTQAGDWLKPGGAFFAFNYGAVQYPHASPAALRVLQEHAQRTRSHVDSRLMDFTPYDDALRAAGCYTDVRRFEVYADHRWSPRALAGFLMSTSYGQAMAIASGDADGCFEDLAIALSAANGGKAILVRFPIEGAHALRR